MKRPKGKFEIDFIELCILAEACIPPVPIARGMFWDNLSDTYYNQMNEHERDRLFRWIIKCSKFNKENEDCQHFYARFNPENQWEVSCFFEGKASVIQAYKFEDSYHITKSRSVNQQYIKSAIKVKPKNDQL